MTKRQSIYITVGGIVLFLGYLLIGTGREMARWEREARQRERRQPHTVYLLDASGDCVAIYGYGLPDAAGRIGSDPATIGHVDQHLCQPGGKGEPSR